MTPASTSSRSSQRPSRVRLNSRLIRAKRVRGASAVIVPSSVPTTISLCWAELVANCATPAINSTVKTASPSEDPDHAATSQPGGSGLAGARAARRPAGRHRVPANSRRDRVVLGQGRQLVVLAAGRGQVGELHDPPGAVGVPVQLDDQVDRAVDLVADRRERDLDVAHRGQRLQPGQRVVGVVGVHRGQRALVAGVHRLQHVQRLAAADLADDDPVRAASAARCGPGRGW